MGDVAGRLIVIVAALVAVLAGATRVRAGESLDGFWMDSDGEVIIELRPCGDSRCGKVVWLKQPLGPEGRPLRDYRNSDPNLRSRPVCGLEVVSGFKKQSDSSWGGGTVYVSDQGTSYSGVANVLSPTKVEVTGYIGLPIFGASEVWTKVSRPPEICSAKAPSAPSAPSATNSKWTTKVVRAPASRSVAEEQKHESALRALAIGELLDPGDAAVHPTRFAGHTSVPLICEAGFLRTCTLVHLS